MLWKGVSAATGPSIVMGWGVRVPLPANSHRGVAPHTNRPLQLGPVVVPVE